MTPLLEVTDVHKSFGEVTALRGVGLTVEARSFHGLIGPNGSGKSTLMHVIAGGLFPDKGTVRLGGREITRSAASERVVAGMSIKFQIPRVFGDLSVHDNVLLALQMRESTLSLLRSRSRRHLAHNVAELLRQFKLSSRAEAMAGELSHGQRQWLEIAMAVATDPKILLLDEPTAGMSPEERRVTGELLAPLRDTCSIVIVEHDLDFIRSFCDVVTVLESGNVLAEGAPGDLESDPRVREVYVTRG